MRRFRLPDPQMYLLQMVAAAASAPIQRLSIETAPRSLKFHFHDLVIPEQQLRILDTFLFPSVTAPSHLVELAVGIEAALNFAEEVLVETSSEDGWWRLAISPKAVRIEPFTEKAEGPACRVVVRKKLEVSALWKSRRHPEISWLETCRHAALKIEVDKSPYATELLPPLPMETILWARIDRAAQETTVLQRGFGAEVLEPTAVLEHPDLFGYLVLTTREAASQHGLIIVHRGLIVHRPLKDLGIPTVCGVLHCDKLKKDLSHTNFVEDESFQEVQIFLRILAARLVTEFCRHPELHREQWKHLWATVVSLLQSGELPPHQETVIRSWAALVHETGESQSPFSSMQKARFLEKEGLQVEAQILRLSLLQKLGTEALTSFDSAQFQHLPETCEVLQGVCSDLEFDHIRNLKLADHFIQALLGYQLDLGALAEPEDPLTLHRLALLRRWQDDLVGAIEFHLKALEHPQADVLVRGWGIRYCAELEFSQERYGQADDLYGMAELELPRQRDLWEERAFFKRFLGESQRDESFSYLRRSIEGVEADSFVHWLLVEEIKKEGRSLLSRGELAALQTKSTYLKLKRLLAEGEQAKIESLLQEQLDPSGWTTRDELVARKMGAVHQAELTFGPTYLYTRYCRRRCVYQLHRMGALKVAENMQCRGHLLEHLRMILAGLPDLEALGAGLRRIQEGGVP